MRNAVLAMIAVLALGAAGLTAARLSTAGPLLAQGEKQRSRVAAGGILYQRYCAACHGADGSGGGPVAAYLRVKPPDLTSLGERYGWPLPRDGLARFIDGRFQPGAHGEREMPVWGEQLEELPPEVVGEREKAAVIDLILDFLESIQGKARTEAGQPPAQARGSRA